MQDKSKIRTKRSEEKNGFDQFQISLGIDYEFLSNAQYSLKMLFKNCIKKQEIDLY